MKNLKKFLAVLLVAAMVTGFSGNVCRAKTKSDVYGDLIKQLKKKEQFADGVYTAKIHDASGNDILLVTDAGTKCNMGGCISECKRKGRAYNNDCFDRFRVSNLQKR